MGDIFCEICGGAHTCSCESGVWVRPLAPSGIDDPDGIYQKMSVCFFDDPQTVEGWNWWNSSFTAHCWDGFDAKTYAAFLTVHTLGNHSPTFTYGDLVTKSVRRRARGDQAAFEAALEKSNYLSTFGCFTGNLGREQLRRIFVDNKGRITDWIN